MGKVVPLKPARPKGCAIQTWTFSDLPAMEIAPGVGARVIPTTCSMEILSVAIRSGVSSEERCHDRTAWIFVLEGRGRLVHGEYRFDLEPGTWAKVPAGVSHRVECITDLGLIVFAPGPGGA